MLRGPEDLRMRIWAWSSTLERGEVLEALVAEEAEGLAFFVSLINALFLC